MLGTHCTAEEAIPVKDTNLSNISWIVSNGNGLFHVRREGWIHVPNSLEVNAVAVNSPGFSHRDQQQIQILKTVRHTRKPAVARPGGLRCNANLAMNSGVIGAEHEVADSSVQFRQR